MPLDQCIQWTDGPRTADTVVGSLRWVVKSIRYARLHYYQNRQIDLIGMALLYRFMVMVRYCRRHAVGRWFDVLQLGVHVCRLSHVEFMKNDYNWTAVLKLCDDFYFCTQYMQYRESFMSEKNLMRSLVSNKKLFVF